MFVDRGCIALCFDCSTKIRGTPLQASMRVRACTGLLHIRPSTGDACDSPADGHAKIYTNTYHSCISRRRTIAIDDHVLGT